VKFVAGIAALTENLRGLRGAISKAEISKLHYAIKALQRGETFFSAS
jgi:hypothetical protein